MIVNRPPYAVQPYRPNPYAPPYMQAGGGYARPGMMMSPQYRPVMLSQASFAPPLPPPPLRLPEQRFPEPTPQPEAPIAPPPSPAPVAAPMSGSSPEKAEGGMSMSTKLAAGLGLAGSGVGTAWYFMRNKDKKEETPAAEVKTETTNNAEAAASGEAAKDTAATVADSVQDVNKNTNVETKDIPLQDASEVLDGHAEKNAEKLVEHSPVQQVVREAEQGVKTEAEKVATEAPGYLRSITNGMGNAGKQAGKLAWEHKKKVGGTLLLAGASYFLPQATKDIISGPAAAAGKFLWDGTKMVYNAGHTGVSAAGSAANNVFWKGVELGGAVGTTAKDTVMTGFEYLSWPFTKVANWFTTSPNKGLTEAKHTIVKEILAEAKAQKSPSPYGWQKLTPDEMDAAKKARVQAKAEIRSSGMSTLPPLSSNTIMSSEEGWLFPTKPPIETSIPPASESINITTTPNTPASQQIQKKNEFQ